MKKRILILINAFLMLTLSVSASNIKDEFEKKLAEASSKNKTIIAQFAEEKGVPKIKNTIKKSGDFYYDNSGKMAMIYTNPKGDKVIMNGSDFVITTNGKQIKSNSQSNPMMAQISYMMQASMSGNVANLGRGWNIEIEKVDSNYKVTISPTKKRIKRYVSAMILMFDDVTMTLDSMRINEAKGGFTAYSFSSKQINQEINDKVFIP